MKWHNTQKNIFPKNGQEVDICVDSINYVAIYDDSEKRFTVKNIKTISFKAESKLIYWKEKVS